ncbi:MAG: YqgE/AlgH family protein [Fibrobacterales bacterium]
MEIHEGNFLLATKLLDNSYFEDSIVFLVEHSESGTYGLTINKVCPMPLNEVFTNTPSHERGLHHFHIGGPVDENLIQIVHTDPSLIEHAKEVQPHIYIGNSFVREESRLPDTNPTNEKVFLGYSGWSPGQLDEEVSQGCWAISTIDPALVLHEYTPYFTNLSVEGFKKQFPT